MSRPLFLIQPDYRGNYIVIGPKGFVQKCEGFCDAVALAKELNDNHARTQTLAAETLSRHFGHTSGPEAV